jgi:hypothetical protein
VPCSQVALIQGPPCTSVRLSAKVDQDNVLHLIVSGGSGCSLELQSSIDLRNWADLAPIAPITDPYDIEIAPPSDRHHFYRLLKLP